MKRTLSLWSVAILTFCGILALASERATAPVVENVRLGVHQSGHTRVVIDMDAAPSFKTFPQNDPARAIVVQVERVGFNFDGRPLPGAKGVVSNVRVGDGRLTITLSEPALPARSFVIEPTDSNPKYRLVLDLDPADSADFAAAANDAVIELASLAVAEIEAAPEQEEPTTVVEAKPEPENKAPADIPAVVTAAAADVQPEPEVVSAPQKPMTRIPRLRPGRVQGEAEVNSDKLMIVIDPGHGGRDPGAIGATGLEEKRVTWSAAQSLGKELIRRGYAVSYTRDGDTSVALEDRIEFARSKQADMFLSIHADANPVASVRGASVYTLSEARSDKMLAEVADEGDFRIFNREFSAEDREVSSILFDLAKTDTQNQSERLATALIRNMQGRMKMVNNTHRHAALVVLLSPDVPAVLVELAFMSNEYDEANLGSRTWRNNATVAIADGIDAYFATGRRAGSLPGSARGN